MARGNAVGRINYALAATLIASGLSYDEAAPQVGSKNGNSLRVGLNRRGVTLRTATNVLQGVTPAQLSSSPVLLRVANAAHQVLSRRSESTRSKHADVAFKVAETIANREVPKHADKLQQYVETWNGAVKGAASVFGWDSDQGVTLVTPGDTIDLIDATEAVTEPLQLEPQVKQ